MNKVQKIAALAARFGDIVPIYETYYRFYGFFPYQHIVGYLWIDDESDNGVDYWRVFLSNGKLNHDRSRGKSYAADYRKDNSEPRFVPGHTGAWESTVIGMTPIRDEAEGKKIFDHVGAKIDEAYDYYMGQVEKKAA